MVTQEAVLERLNPPDLYKHWSDPDFIHIVHREMVSQEERSSLQRLMVIGSYHDTDPQRWYYDTAFRCFEYWEETTRGRPRIIIAEGEQDLWGRASTLQESIRQHYSEVGWQCFLADAYDIPIISGEPPDYGEIPYIMKYASAENPEDEPIDLSEELVAAYLGRELPLHFRMEGSKPDEEIYMRRMCTIYQRKLGRLALTHPEVASLDFSYEHFLALHKKYFGREFGPITAEMNDLYLKYTSAEMEDEAFARLPVARIAPHIMKWRNAHYGMLIGDYWQRGFSIFSWYGMNHTLTLGENLKEHGNKAANPWGLVVEHKFHQGIIGRPSLNFNWERRETIESYVQDRILTKKRQQAFPWPEWLVQHNTTNIRKRKIEFIQEHFRARAALPISTSLYGRYITQIPRQWDPAFFDLCKWMESLAEGGIDAPLNTDPNPYPTWQIRELILTTMPTHQQIEARFGKDNPATKTLSQAMTRMWYTFGPAPADFQAFDERLLHIFDDLTVLATPSSAEQVQGTSTNAVNAFDRISKHMCALRIAVYNIDGLGLTATEELYYVLDFLNHMLQPNMARFGHTQ